MHECLIVSTKWQNYVSTHKLRVTQFEVEREVSQLNIGVVKCGVFENGFNRLSV